MIILPEYKGYNGTAEVNLEHNILLGMVLGIQDIVTYAATTPALMEKAFQEAVDHYLEQCKELGDEPNQPFKGSFNVRIGIERHKNLAFIAANEGISLNELICKIIDSYKS